MDAIEKLNSWSFPDTKQIPDGYDLKAVPDLSARNIEVLMDKINEIIDTVNQIIPTNK